MKKFPRREEKRPRAIKINEKPPMKKREWRSILRLNDLSARSLLSLMVTPLI